MSRVPREQHEAIEPPTAEENSDLPLSRFATLCRNIDSVVGALERDGNLSISFRNEIDQLKEVAGTLQHIEGHDKTSMSLASAHRYDDPIYEGIARGDRGDRGSRRDDPYGERPELRPRTRARPATRHGGGRHVSHYPSPLIKHGGQERIEEDQRMQETRMSWGSQSNQEGQDDADEERGGGRGETVVPLEERRELSERIGRTRQRREAPRRETAYYEPERVVRYPELTRIENFWVPPFDLEPELLCAVDRASLDVDMRNPDWRSSNNDHIIVAYYRDVPNQGLAGERHDEGSSRIRRQGTFNKTSKRPERIRINSEVLITELENITGILFRDLPLLLIPPYKAFFLFWPEMQNRLVELKEEVNQDSNPTEELINKNKHLKCLVEFIEEDFAEFLDIMKGAEKKTLETVSFQDLWCLFNPGDIVISDSNGYERAFMVYSVSGGRNRLSDIESYPREETVFDAFRGRSVRPRRDRYERIEEREIIVHPYSRAGRSTNSSEVGSHTALTLDCFYLDFDGEFVAPCQKTLHVGHFSGQKKISDIGVIPTWFGDDTEAILDGLRKRGKRFVSLHGHKLYHGLVASTSEEVVGEVYIDQETGYAEAGGWSKYNPELGKLSRTSAEASEYTFATRPPKRIGTRSDVQYERDRSPVPTRSEADIDIEIERMGEFLREYSTFLSPVNPKSDHLAPDQLLLLPECSFGYVFRSRRWLFLSVDDIKDVKRTDEERVRGFNDLVIPLSYRQMLLALVENHARGSAEVQGMESSASGHMDLVAGKGNGLIILLHGPPGAGKTSTAETIAAYTKRPLYSITCGDIGTIPEAIERSLENHFRLANKWGCVLLLDEADVFMAKRDWHSMERNAAVSVFLRVLEYYAGILFLTTNRIGVIDEAFKSRIHVSLRYPSLDLPSTKSIWENLFNVISRDNQTQALKVEFDKDDLLDFAHTHFLEHEARKTTWNGRQIRNAFQTAIALGRTDRIKLLKKKHLTEEEAEKKGKKRGKDKYLKIHLTRKNFTKIAHTANEFEEYMVNVRGSDIGVAKNELVRNDEFLPGGVTAGKVYRPLPQSFAQPGQAAVSRNTARSPKPEEPPLWKSNSRPQNSTVGGGEHDDTDTSSTSSDDDSSETEEAATATSPQEMGTRGPKMGGARHPEILGKPESSRREIDRRR